MDTSGYCLFVTHYYIVGASLARGHPNVPRPRLTTTSGCGVGSPTPGHAPGSRMALHIFPDRGLRHGLEAQSVALAIESYRREFLLTKHRDDPIQRNTARAPDKFGVHEPIWLDFSWRKTSIGNSAN